MRSRLHPIASVSCGPTAVCAVTGSSSELACDTMMRAVDFDGPRPTHLNDSAFRHQVRAIAMLGFEVLNADGSPFDVAGAPMNPPADQATYDAAPTIADFVITNKIEDIVVCYACGPGGSHTFTADGSSFFDNNTGGHVVDASGIHSQVRDLKVIRIFRIRPQPAAMTSGSNS